MGEHFYIILAGTCDVMKTKPGSDERSHEATLCSGQYFGEMALVRRLHGYCTLLHGGYKAVTRPIRQSHGAHIHGGCIG